MKNLKAVIFDLDNTLLDRTKIFYNFATLFVDQYFPHISCSQNIINRIVELDQDGYRDKNELFTELLEDLPWEEKPEHKELMEYYSLHYVKHFKCCLVSNSKKALTSLSI